MCFRHDAEPPELPPHLRRPIAVADVERLTLTSADGTPFSVAVALAADGAGRPAVVILPDVRGLYPFYEQLAQRFAQAGHHAIVVDYFGRTAGLGPRDDDFDYWPHTRAAEAHTIRDDIAAAAAALGERTGADAFVTVGFCFGGTNAFLSATYEELPLAAAVGFYGGLDPEAHGMQVPSPVERASATRVPVLALFGGADEGIPQHRIDAYAAGLREAGVEAAVHVYPGAPHSFFDRAFAQFADESSDAWDRVLTFIAHRSRATS